LLVKVIVPEQTLFIVSSMIFFIVQILESVRTRYTSYNGLARRVSFEISLATSSQECVVCYKLSSEDKIKDNLYIE